MSWELMYTEVMVNLFWKTGSEESSRSITSNRCSYDRRKNFSQFFLRVLEEAIAQYLKNRQDKIKIKFPQPRLQKIGLFC